VAAAQCVFCRIIAGEVPADIVWQDSEAVAFLDSHPVFHGHVLLCPREHYDTLLDLPADLAGPMMTRTQGLARAVEKALEADGTFIAVNNRVSQTVPHLHIHVIPRRRKDGLRGFFWPRQHYADDLSRQKIRDAIKEQAQKVLGS
jgi:histidine triad (HIT) family protein